MLLALSVYIIYNIVLGATLSVYAFYKDRYTAHGYELLILLFPTVGYGYWLYHSDLRTSGRTGLPLNWYIWKKMIRVNWGFIISLCILAVLTMAGCGAMVGGGLDWADHQNNASAVGLGLIYNAVSFVVFALILLSVLLGVGFVALIMILVPYLIAGYREELLSHEIQ